MQSLQVLPGPRQEYEDGKIVATVGTIPILAGDVRCMINQAIHGKMISAPPPGEEKAFYEAAMRPVLKQMVEMKLVVNDAKQTIPATALPKIEGEVNRDFDKTQIPKLMEDYHADNQHDLDEKLRAVGSSLDWERHSFFERNMFMGWRNQQVKEDQQIPLADVLGYYEQHLLDYEYPAQARWEELMVSFDQFPDKAAAYAAIAQMGNRVMQGVPFAEVAKASSQGYTADKGGANDWTTQGSLACKALDESLFQLPVGSLSGIIESDHGFHIIRVVERKAAGKKSFEDTQGDIKKQLKEDNRKKQLEKYLAELHKKTPIHTVFDDQPGGLDGPPKVAEHNF
jgi:PPIC-type PPIASE domain